MTDAIGREVLRLRGDRSALWLSNRTEELGFKVSRGGISQLETGKRQSISVAEWLILAAALEVPPLQLLAPTWPLGTVEALPRVSIPTGEFQEWFEGTVEYRNHFTESENERAALVKKLEAFDAVMFKISTWDDMDEETYKKWFVEAKRGYEETMEKLRKLIYTEVRSEG